MTFNSALDIESVPLVWDDDLLDKVFEPIAAEYASLNINAIKKLAKGCHAVQYQVWIKLKTNGGADGGFTFFNLGLDDFAELQEIGDLFMPSHDDSTILLNHLQDYDWKISDIGFSLFRDK